MSQDKFSEYEAFEVRLIGGPCDGTLVSWCLNKGTIIEHHTTPEFDPVAHRADDPVTEPARNIHKYQIHDYQEGAATQEAHYKGATKSED